jgi:hypothetical protein
MLSTLVEAYNQTPENFVPPSDSVLEMVQRQLEKELAQQGEEQRVQEMECFNQEIKQMTAANHSITM